MADHAPAELQLHGPSVVLAERYRLEALVGRGGMAEVHRAHDVVLDRTVAVKVFNPSVQADGDRERFCTEVHLLASMTHPNLVQLYDAGVDDTQPWFALQYVDGGTLADLPTPIAPSRLAALGAQVASALAHVHDHGVVHRDVKPGNVLLDTHGQAYLADFGIARLVDGGRLTQTGLMLGTAAFLSPEQVRGEAVTTASDVYALGLVLLETLTGRREYEGLPIEAAMARLWRDPVVPHGLPDAWRELLQAMTAADSADRPGAGEVHDRLERLAQAVDADELPLTVLSGVAPVPPADTAAMPMTRPVARPASLTGPVPVTVAPVPAGPRSLRGRRGLALLPAGAAASVLAAAVLVGAGPGTPSSPADEAARPAPTVSSPTGGEAARAGPRVRPAADGPRAAGTTRPVGPTSPTSPTGKATATGEAGTAAGPDAGGGAASGSGRGGAGPAGARGDGRGQDGTADRAGTDRGKDRAKDRGKGRDRDADDGDDDGRPVTGVGRTEEDGGQDGTGEDKIGEERAGQDRIPDRGDVRPDDSADDDDDGGGDDDRDGPDGVDQA